MLNFFTEYTQELSLAVAAFAALVSVISAIIALAANFQNKKQYLDSIQPQLSMSLEEFDHELFLRIKNTGKISAKEIFIIVHRLANNGNWNELKLDNLFLASFELYPEEIVQGKIGLTDGALGTDIFPMVEISVSYKCGNTKRKHNYDRSVTYFRGYSKKVAADICVDTDNIESSLASMDRAAVRTANYLDGRQVSVLDETNILAGKSLKSDFLEIKNKENNNA